MPAIGSVVDGKYKIIEKIGQGGMSVVYLAINERANKTWAVKEVRRDGVQDYEVVRQGLLVETDLLKKLHHEGLPGIADVIEEENTLLIVMDYIEGSALDRILREQGPQPQEKVVEWGRQLCEVLGYLHAQNPPIIYRDMKPSNIMLKPDGRVVLIDFGTAREFKGSHREDTIPMGTRGYAAPEQYGGEGETTPRTDIYSLGATLYHLVTGQNPGEAPYEIVPLRSLNPQLSSGLEKIIEKCTRPNPEERYATCAELAFDLEHYREMDRERIRSRHRKEAALLACAALSGMLALGSVGFRWAERSTSADQYEALIQNARESEDEEGQVESYRKAADRDPTRSEAYIGLLRALYEDGDAFTSADSESFRSVLNAVGNGRSRSNRSCLEQNREEYAKLAWEAALTYYYRGSGSGSRTMAKSWCDAVVEAGEEAFEEKGEAKVLRCRCLSKICEYYQNVGKRSETGDAVVSYREYWDDLSELTAGNLAETDVALTAYVMYREVVSQAAGHTAEFLDAGVTQEEIAGKLSDIEEHLEKDFTDADRSSLSEELQELTGQIANARISLSNVIRSRTGGEESE